MSGVCSLSPVQCNAAQMKDGGGGQQDIQRGSDQAAGLTVPPATRGQLDGRKRHHY